MTTKPPILEHIPSDVSKNSRNVDTRDIPLIFTGPMVRAILNDLKWKTRRLKFSGNPGDAIWVRETWNAWMSGVDACDPYLWTNITPADRLRAKAGKIAYAATDEPLDSDPEAGRRWAPSIHMPRWASRILLRVEDVREERLQDISPDDAEAEGLWRGKARRHLFWQNATMCRLVDGQTHTEAFAELWESIHGPGSWSANPVVQVVTFSRVEPKP